MHITIFLPLNQASHPTLLATNHLWIKTMESPVLVRSAPLQWMKLCEFPPCQDTQVCFSYPIQRSGAVVCDSPATAWQNNFLFAKGNFPMSWANEDSHAWRFDFSNSYIMPVVVKSIKKSRHIPQSKAKKVWQASFQPCLHWSASRQTAIIGGGRITGVIPALHTNLLSFLKGYIRKP